MPRQKTAGGPVTPTSHSTPAGIWPSLAPFGARAGASFLCPETCRETRVQWVMEMAIGSGPAPNLSPPMTVSGPK